LEKASKRPWVPDGATIKLKGVKLRALLVAQLFLKLDHGNLDRSHRDPGDVEP
jgi:hypothetical protein